MITNTVKKIAGLALLAAFAYFTSAKAAENSIVNPWVITDCSVNCFDYQSMISDLTRGLTDPQEQAIAGFPVGERQWEEHPGRHQSRLALSSP